MRRSELPARSRRFEQLTAATLMERYVVPCRPTDSGSYIAAQLTYLGVGSLPVVDDDWVLLGLVSEFDLLRVLLQGRSLERVRALAIMSRDLRVVHEDTPVEEIIRLLRTEHRIRVPVVRDRKLVGVVARRDVLFGYLRCQDSLVPRVDFRPVAC